DAEKVLADKSAKQKEVDVAVDAINEILQNLTEKPIIDFSKLEAAIEAGNKVDTTNLTDESKAALTKAMADAEKVLADKSITQKEVDVAVEAINEILQNLTEKPTVDFSKLEAAIKAGNKVDATNLTDESKTALTKAMADAEKVLADKSITQKEVDVAAEAINEILQNLTEKPTVDKSELEGLIVSASNMNTDGNTEESIQNLLNAIEKANQILNNNDVTQKEVDQAIKELTQAVKNLEEISVPTVSKEALVKLINQVEDEDLTVYTEETVAELQTALGRAKVVVANQDAKQKEVDQVFQSLKQAKTNLIKAEIPVEPEEPTEPAEPEEPTEPVEPEEPTEPVEPEEPTEPVEPEEPTEPAEPEEPTEPEKQEENQVNKNELNSIIEAAQAIDTDKKTPESSQALENALVFGNKILADEDASQETINQAILDIEQAISGLVNIQVLPHIELIDPIKSLI